MGGVEGLGKVSLGFTIELKPHKKLPGKRGRRKKRENRETGREKRLQSVIDPYGR